MKTSVPRYYDVATCTIFPQASTYGHSQIKHQNRVWALAQKIYFSGSIINSHSTVHPLPMNSQSYSLLHCCSAHALACCIATQ